LAAGSGCANDRPVGKGIRGAPRDALIAESVPVKQRGFAFGFNRAADHLGAVFGPVASFLLLSIFAANTPKSDDPRIPAGFLIRVCAGRFRLLVIASS